MQNSEESLEEKEKIKNIERPMFPWIRSRGPRIDKVFLRIEPILP